MKVVFLENVPDVAKAGETKEVADGYGRNFLIPKKLAVLANSAASNVVEAQLKVLAHRQAQVEAEMAELAGQLEGKKITLKARTGAKNRLYGSVTSADIADEISNSLKAIVDKRKIELEEPIRELGTYEITIRFTGDITSRITLVVADEEEKEKKEPKEPKAGKAKKPVKEKAEVDKEVEKEEVGEEGKAEET